ncbi:MAG: site-specific DNA-methyltransferase [Thermoplasmata archaeon]|nr:site-specific DNA-methyltransferase [Thermoplasmata archaeon]
MRRTRAPALPGRRPRLNELTGREWIRFTRSWFVENPPPRRPEERAHPAKFPESLAAAFIGFFTRAGEWVVDPFAGTGSTLVAAQQLGRPSWGLELNPRFARAANLRLARGADPSAVPARVFAADARRLRALRTEQELARPSFVLTSPPYWDMLRQSRGGVRSVHRRRAESGLATQYSRDHRDLGNTTGYEPFLRELLPILRDAGSLLGPGRYMVVVLQNLRDPSGAYRRLAWEVASGLDRGALEFQGERIWCQDSKPLGIWGYPVTFVPNIHHHYCLVFRRRASTTGGSDDRGGASRPRARTPRASPPRRAGGAARLARR